jgi:hypothetical protein
MARPVISCAKCHLPVKRPVLRSAATLGTDAGDTGW